MPLQFRRGTNANRTTITPLVGEPLWTTDTNKLYIGDGITAGGVLVQTDVTGLSLWGVANNGYNYVFNSTVNTITNSASAAANTIGGGGNIANPNRIVNNSSDTTCSYRTISGGYDNVIGSDQAADAGLGGTFDGAIASTISGGAHHRIRRPTSTADAPFPAISAATQPNSGNPRTAVLTLDQPDHGTIGGGGYNAIRNGNYGTIAGGSSNIIQGEQSTWATGYAATIGGGEGNEATGNGSTVAGGQINACRAAYSTVSGGVNNSIIGDLTSAVNASNTASSVLGGGNDNDILYAQCSTISGGNLNKIGTGATGASTDTGSFSTISGGYANTIGSTALAARYSSINGGASNSVNQWYASIPGGYNNLIGPSSFPNGEYSIAIGRDAECQTHMTLCQGGSQFTGGVRGSCQTMTTVINIVTTGNTATDMIVGGNSGANSGSLAMPSDSAWAFRAMIIGRQTNANTVQAFEITGLVTNNTGVAALVGSPVVTAIGTAGTWTATAVVNGTDSRLYFRVTGAAATTIWWVGRVEITQVIA